MKDLKEVTDLKWQSLQWYSEP